MNPVYAQLLGVIVVIVALGALGIFFARRERLHREQSNPPVGRGNPSAASGAEAEEIAQHR